MSYQKIEVAAQIKLSPGDGGLMVVVFSEYDVDKKIAVQIASFVIPWHEVAPLCDRMERLETSKVEQDAGINPF